MPTFLQLHGGSIGQGWGVLVYTCFSEQGGWVYRTAEQNQQTNGMDRRAKKPQDITTEGTVERQGKGKIQGARIGAQGISKIQRPSSTRGFGSKHGADLYYTFHLSHLHRWICTWFGFTCDLTSRRMLYSYLVQFSCKIRPIYVLLELLGVFSLT